MTKTLPKPDKNQAQKSLLRSGLPSEFFILCFVKPDKPYEIAKTIKNVNTVPDASKIYPAREKLVNRGYLEKKGASYYPIYPKVAQEIAEFLQQEKNEALDENEIQLLEYFLRNTKFVRLAHDEVRKMIQTQKKGIRNIDSLKFIASMVGAISLFLWSVKRETSKSEDASRQLDEMSKQISVEYLEQFEAQWETFSEILMKNFGKFFANRITIKSDDNSDEFDGMDKNELVKVMFSSIPVILMMVSTELLRKLSKMAEGEDAMNIIGIILDNSSSD